MGYDLKEGVYENRPLSNDEMWKTMNWFFSIHSVNETSYKFIFFKAIIDCLGKRNHMGRLTFEQIFTRFTEISWNIILKYNIKQKATTNDKKESILEQILHEYSMTSLDNFFVEWRDISVIDCRRLCKKVSSKCKRYVVGALFDDMNRLFYSFNKKEEWIELNPVMVKFIIDNKSIIENLNYYKWAKFYNKVNNSEVEKQLSFLIENGFTRINESLYRAMLAYEFERKIDTIKISDLPNTIEILLESDNLCKNVIENELNDTVEREYEDEIYESYEKMRQYLNDPILLISKMKKR